MDNSKFISSIQKVMGAAVSQQRASAKNIANQNTPGYHRIEVDFKQVLRSINNTQKVQIGRTNRGHFTALNDRRAEQVKPVEVKDSIEKGKVNNVDLDNEMGIMAKTQLYYAVLTRVMRQRFSNLDTATTGRNR